MGDHVTSGEGGAATFFTPTLLNTMPLFEFCKRLCNWEGDTRSNWRKWNVKALLRKTFGIYYEANCAVK